MILEFIKPQNLDSLFMKSSQMNFNLRSPGSYLVRGYLITTVKLLKTSQAFTIGTTSLSCRSTLGSFEKFGSEI